MSDTTNNLTFTKSVSVNRFKAINGISKLNIVKSPKTGKFFFVCPEDSSIRGTISTTIDYNKDLMISDVVNTEDGTSFLMLHNDGNSSANVIQTL